MIDNFEKRYEKLLSNIDKKNLKTLKCYKDINVITKKEEIDCCDNGFIQNFCFGEVCEELLLDKSLKKVKK